MQRTDGEAMQRRERHKEESDGRGVERSPRSLIATLQGHLLDEAASRIAVVPWPAAASRHITLLHDDLSRAASTTGSRDKSSQAHDLLNVMRRGFHLAAREEMQRQKERRRHS